MACKQKKDKMSMKKTSTAKIIKRKQKQKHEDEIKEINKTDKIGEILEASTLENLVMAEPGAGSEEYHMDPDTVNTIFNKAHKRLLGDKGYLDNIENMATSKKKKRNKK
ncbi:MAG: hypothetical protein ACP5RI_00875 [Candidatus Micrarchaeia archaeon]